MEGRLEEGEGAAARISAVTGGGAASLTVLSAKASISSVEDCVTCGAAVPVIAIANGSGELRPEWAVAKEPGPEDCDEAEEEEPFLEDLVDRAPPRNREANTTLGESLGNHGL